MGRSAIAGRMALGGMTTAGTSSISGAAGSPSETRPDTIQGGGQGDMLFNSVEFIYVFLPTTLLFFFVLSRFSHTASLVWLLLGSFVFYARTSVSFVPILATSICVNYAVSIIIQRLAPQSKARKYALMSGIGANLLCLFYFKYYAFFVDNLDATGLVALAPRQIELPLGISFFTFTQIAFLVDSYESKVHEAKFANYALFVSYFPHLIAGPILHHKEMMPQFSKPSTFRLSSENVAVGLTIFFIGLFKKVILADGISSHVHEVFDAAAQGARLTTIEAWSGALCYALQIYFDFSGYSDMAIGLSRLFNVLLPLNFNSPYKATSIIDFWRRWHMTLSRFLRDYLYIPLGGNRRGSRRRLANVMIVMLLGGLWHGAAWTFVVWGGLHGLYLMINHAWHWLVGENRWNGPLARGAGGLVTFASVVFAWVFFRAPDLPAAFAMVKGMLGLNGIGAPLPPSVTGWLRTHVGTAVVDAGSPPHLPSAELAVTVALLLAVVWLCPNTQEIMAAYRPAINFPPAEPRRSTMWLWRPHWTTGIALGGMGAAALATIVYIKRVGDFIYFQF